MRKLSADDTRRQKFKVIHLQYVYVASHRIANTLNLSLRITNALNLLLRIANLLLRIANTLSLLLRIANTLNLLLRIANALNLLLLCVQEFSEQRFFAFISLCAD